MARDFIITNAVAQAMLNTFTAQADAGTAAVIQIYTVGSGIPADADVAISDQTLLAELTMSATSFGAASDATGKARITANSITAANAGNTGTASFFRILTQNGGTTICQGTAGTSDADLIMNTTSITSGSNVSISAATVDLAEQA